MRSWGMAESSHRAFAHWFHVGVGLRLRVPGAEVEQRLPCVQAWTATAACCRHCAFDLIVSGMFGDDCRAEGLC